MLKKSIQNFIGSLYASQSVGDAKDKKDAAKKPNDKPNPEEGKKGYRFIINEKKEKEETRKR